MLAGLPEEDGSLTAEAVEPALKAIRRADAVVLGPGLGRSEGAQAFARALFERVDVPLVVDADGLNALAGVFRDELPQRRWPTVLTPHAGELGRLLGVESAEIGAERLAHARAAAAHARAIVVLKGDDTLVAAPDRPRGDLAGRRARPGHRRAPATSSPACSARCSPRGSRPPTPPAPPSTCTCGPGRLAAEPHGPDARDRLRRDRPPAAALAGLDFAGDGPNRARHHGSPTSRRVTVADSVETVLHVLRDHELPGVPVVNEGGRCVGIITEADLVLTDENEDFHMPHYFQLIGGIVFLESVSHWEERVRKAFAATAEDMMTADPITIEPTATVREAAHLIARKKHNRLPVIEHGRLVGVVTRVDVLDALTSDDED